MNNKRWIFVELMDSYVLLTGVLAGQKRSVFYSVNVASSVASHSYTQTQPTSAPCYPLSGHFSSVLHADAVHFAEQHTAVAQNCKLDEK